MISPTPTKTEKNTIAIIPHIITAGQSGKNHLTAKLTIQAVPGSHNDLPKVAIILQIDCPV